MSEVHFLSSDQEKRLATFRWISSGVRRLNRQNKVSSAAFSCPTSVAPGAPVFRVVVLRGVVKAPLEQDDPFAIFLELLPHATPTAPAAAPAASSAPSTSSTVIPGNVNVSFVIGPPEAADRVTASVHGHLSQTEKNLGVKEIFSAAQYEKLCFPETDALCIDVTVAFDVPVLDSVVRASKTIGSSLWGGASTTFSTFGSALASWGGKVTHLLDDTFNFGREEAPNSPASHNAPCPWDLVPTKWIDRPHRWSFFLTQYLPQNDNVFLIHPRSFTSEEELLLIEAGLSANACIAAGNVFDFDRDVHQGLLTAEQRLLRTMRFDLVPGRLTEEEFWRNYFWRVECLKLCSSDEQAQILLSIVNAPVRANATMEATMASAWKTAESNCDTACALCEEILEETVTDANAAMLHSAVASVALAVETLKAFDGTNPDEMAIVRGMIERGEKVAARCRAALSEFQRAQETPVAATTVAPTDAVARPVTAGEVGTTTNTSPKAPVRSSTQGTDDVVEATEGSHSVAPAPLAEPVEVTATPPKPLAPVVDTVPQTQAAAPAAPAPAAAAAPSPPRAGSVEANFARMPWEEDDD